MFNNSAKVFHEIDELIWMHDLSLIEAVILYSEKTGMEIEFLAEILKKNDVMKFQLELEAEGLHFLKKTDRLPV